MESVTIEMNENEVKQYRELNRHSQFRCRALSSIVLNDLNKITSGTRFEQASHAASEASDMVQDFVYETAKRYALIVCPGKQIESCYADNGGRLMHIRFLYEPKECQQF